jgi:dephospho-CoA kinase
MQTDLESKRRLAAHTIDNSGSLEETRRQVRALYAEWRRAAGRGGRD